MFYVRVTTIPSTAGPVTIHEDVLRLLVWIVADATLVDERKYNPGSTKRRVQFKLSRPEKIQKLRLLLERMQTPYTVKLCKRTGVNKLQPWYVRIYGDAGRAIFSLLSDRKQFPVWFCDLDRDKAMILFDTLGDTDGCWVGQTLQWNTTSQNDSAIVGALCKEHGFTFSVRIVEHGSGFKYDCKPQYRSVIGFERGRPPLPA